MDTSIGLKRRNRYKLRKGVDVKTENENSSLPFEGKVVLAKEKKPDGWLMIILQVGILCFCLVLLYFSFNRPELLQFYVTWFYAHLGHSHAQHLIGQKYLQGYAVEKNRDQAMHWFKKAADQGHPEASYNLAVAHLKGIPTHIKHDKEVHNLLQNAVNQKMDLAEKVYAHWCSHKPCDQLIESSEQY
ncbi:hypothetical protein CHUAL_008474 [Chamberlinius hualienensis]